MLVVNRYPGEGVAIGPGIRVMVSRCKGGQVWLAIEAPPGVPITRTGRPDDRQPRSGAGGQSPKRQRR